jgi:hypothetical protein
MAPAKIIAKLSVAAKPADVPKISTFKIFRQFYQFIDRIQKFGSHIFASSVSDESRSSDLSDAPATNADLRLSALVSIAASFPLQIEDRSLITEKEKRPLF